jgi:hypothetical protein
VAVQTVTVAHTLIGVEANRNDLADSDGANQLTPNNTNNYSTFDAFTFNTHTGNWEALSNPGATGDPAWKLTGLTSIGINVERANPDSAGGYGGVHVIPGLTNTELDTLYPGTTVTGSSSGGTPWGTYTRFDTQWVSVAVDLTGYDPDTDNYTDYFVPVVPGIAETDGVQTPTFEFSPPIVDPAGIGVLTFTPEVWAFGNRSGSPVQLPLFGVVSVVIDFTKAPIVDPAGSGGAHLGLAI